MAALILTLEKNDNVTLFNFIELKENEILKFVCFGENVIFLRGHLCNIWMRKFLSEIIFKVFI